MLNIFSRHLGAAIGGAAAGLWGLFPATAAAAEPPVATAPIVASAPVIDGKLDDAVWRDVRPQPVARLADDSADATHPATFRTLVHGGRLYFALSMPHPDPKWLGAQPVLRDDVHVFKQDCIELFLSTRYDSTDYHHLAFGPTGSFYDNYELSRQQDHNLDVEHAAIVGDQGWTLEVAIGLDTISSGLTIKPGHAIALNVCREFRTASDQDAQNTAWSPPRQPFLHVRGAFGKLLVGTYPEAAAQRIVDLDELWKQYQSQPHPPELQAEAQRAQEAIEDLRKRASSVRGTGQWLPFEAAVRRIQDDLHQLLADHTLRFYEMNPWQLPSSTDLSMDDARELEQIQVTAFEGEYVTRAVCAMNYTDEPQRLQWRLTNLYSSDLRRGIPGSRHLQLREAVEVNLRGGGGKTIRDALPRLDLEHHMSIAQKRNGVLWLTIDTHGLPAGTWIAGLEAFPLLDPPQAKSFRIVIRVLPAPFPQGPRPYAITWPGYSPAKGIDIDSPAVIEDLQSHFTNVIMTGLRFPRFNEQGQMIEPADFSKLEKHLRQYGIKGNHFVIALHYRDWPASMGKGDYTAQQQERFAAVVGATRAFFEKHGLTVEDYSWYAHDEPYTPQDANLVVEFCRRLREADPQQRTFVTATSHADRESMQRMAECVSLWVPVEGLAQWQWDLLLSRREAGVRFFSYSILVKANPPYGAYRMSAWKALARGFEGIGAWNYSHVGGLTNWDETDGNNSYDYAMIYEGADGRPIPSARWEAWRQGIQDYRLLEWADQLVFGNTASDVQVSTSPAITAMIRKVLESRDHVQADHVIAALQAKIIARLREQNPDFPDALPPGATDLPCNLTNNGGILSQHLDTRGQYTLAPDQGLIPERAGTGTGPTMFTARRAVGGPQAESGRDGSLTDNSLRDNSKFHWTTPPPDIEVTFEFPDPYRFSHGLISWNDEIEMGEGQSIDVLVSADGRDGSWTRVDTLRGPDAPLNDDREMPVDLGGKTGRFVRLHFTTRGTVTCLREVRLWGWPVK